MRKYAQTLKGIISNDVGTISNPTRSPRWRTRLFMGKSECKTDSSINEKTMKHNTVLHFMV